MADQIKTMNVWQRWMLAIRPKTLPAAAAGVVAGCGVAFTLEQFHIGAALAALCGALLIQVGANLVNDVADFYRGADTKARLGPTRVTHTGLLSAGQVWSGVVIVFALAGLAGVYMTFVAGWPVIVIGLASILAAIAYTAGPCPLAYIGLGDLFVMIFFGFIAVCGTVFVVGGRVPESAWWVAVAVGALTVNILVVNNIRDIETDRKAGRKNIPVVLGRKAAEWEFALMLALAFLVPLLLIVRDLASCWVLLTLLSLPRGLKLWKMLHSGLEGPPLNDTLANTAQMLLLYSVLLAIGFVIG